MSGMEIDEEKARETCDEAVFSVLDLVDEKNVEGRRALAELLIERADLLAPKHEVKGLFLGCFDMMHSGMFANHVGRGEFSCVRAGHYNALRQARKLCTHLVAGSHAQSDIIREKGAVVVRIQLHLAPYLYVINIRPFSQWTEAERNATVAACRWVDTVETGIPYEPVTAELLDRLGCAFCIHGDDMPKSTKGGMYVGGWVGGYE
jgi:glycerol-3-phosphate cytidylyltransferase-like family protein